ncbi:MlaC/ttg2D family ABC transporter substrate-binding protein [Uliginosibacterium aquaticum]|uniref:ABC transporter substrate-binding protein n=1 Tax=Uliginosibacterium aquaticum TaxID=2731212 RepID=A0ABX2ID37_9RHOO|nr:ABC transporter substrate-binding protein [Uliginosibacterium aquaticum]NSL54381.1 ABC transporter substrate-binding protein [Uliginosibacterium aquaticum]
MKLIKFLSSLLLSVFALQAVAQEAPDALAKRVMNEVLEIVRTDKSIQSGDQKRIFELVDAKVLPHFDFRHMTALAMGREWRNASAEQKEAMTAEFKILLVRSYSNALAQYKNQTIDFKPIRMQAADSDVIVRTEVKQAGTKPVSIDYQMEKLAEGWKVYDVMVAGVSLVTNYRETFAQEIKAGGIDGLIKSLKTKNAQAEVVKK